MKNIDRLARHIAKTGAENILVHTIPGTQNWIVCQKIGDDEWALTLSNPEGNVTYSLGTVNNANHLRLWTELVKLEIEKHSSAILLSKDLKQLVHNYLKQYAKEFKKFTKLEVRKESQRSKKAPK